MSRPVSKPEPEPVVLFEISLVSHRILGTRDRVRIINEFDLGRSQTAALYRLVKLKDSIRMQRNLRSRSAVSQLRINRTISIQFLTLLVSIAPIGIIRYNNNNTLSSY